MKARSAKARSALALEANAARKLLEREGQLFDGMKAHIGIAGHRAFDDGGQSRLDLGREARELRRRLGRDLQDELIVGVSIEGLLSGQHLEQYDSDRVNIGAHIDVP